ncbi:molecular chaperone [Glaciimonas sp. PAMC28666]|uniref:fimbrial biogenesis chaperone n=1 Tax=Glaciimonas sp. PAMC28666 TaxID=2807626 RepID=UPI0019669CF6|nr:molecular chaperone [Glaciimonas sp. PAMC28666]QRX83426.1 molecular chaperone [Glaciimonas sp. PAMC28666]
MRLLTLFLLQTFLLGQAHASVIIDRTRIIYAGDKSDVSVHLSNEGEVSEAALVQAWIEEGNPANGSDAPFVISPPMFRIDPKKAQNIRIFFSHERDLTQTEETLFWFNINEIPALSPKQADANILQFSIHSKIKLFFRPIGLKGDPSAAPGLVTWTINDHQLHAANPTPYYLSFISFMTCTSGICFEDKSGGMIAPFSIKDFPLVKNAGSPLPDNKEGELIYQFLDDYGASVAGIASVVRAK